MARKAQKKAAPKKAMKKAPAKKAVKKAATKKAAATSSRRDSDVRRRQIEEVALKLIIKNGYRATSMLTVARQAKASNETMYKWYGSKQALIEAIAKNEADDLGKVLDDAISAESKPDKALGVVGPLILKYVTNDRNVALVRAASGDVHDTGTIGKTVASGERDMMAAKLAPTFEDAQPPRKRDKKKAKEAADLYLSTLIGDLQVRRAIGARGALSPKEITQRSDLAADIALKFAKG